MKMPIETSDNLTSWNIEVENISVKEFDNLILARQQADAAYKEHKAAADAELANRNQLDAKIISLLQAQNKDRYYLNEVGVISLKTSWSVATPKTREDKQRLYDYIRQKYGDEALQSKIGINSQTLNAFMRQEMEEALRDGDAAFTLPGCGQPQAFQSLSVRKK